MSQQAVRLCGKRGLVAFCPACGSWESFVAGPRWSCGTCSYQFQEVDDYPAEDVEEESSGDKFGNPEARDQATEIRKLIKSIRDRIGHTYKHRTNWGGLGATLNWLAELEVLIDEAMSGDIGFHGSWWLYVPEKDEAGTVSEGLTADEALKKALEWWYPEGEVMAAPLGRQRSLGVYVEDSDGE